LLKATALPEPSQLMPMKEAVTAALQRLESRILDQGATVIQPNTWPQINGVASWLETVWWNFLANALQHANKAPLRIELGWERENEHFRFWISDNGGGVPSAKQLNLFQPFDRLHDPEASSGLGLAIAHRLVDLQGGTCGYRENPGGGACFFFQLP
jgi:signal transduction histidine kinase